MYNFKTDPYQHQLEVYECSKDRDYWAFLWKWGRESPRSWSIRSATFGINKLSTLF